MVWENTLVGKRVVEGNKEYLLLTETNEKVFIRELKGEWEQWN